MIPWKVKTSWARLWMNFAGLHSLGKAATWIAALSMPPYNGKREMANMNKKGFVSPSASIFGEKIQLGHNIYIDDHVIMYCDPKSGDILIGDRVAILRGTIIQLGIEGELTIGRQTCIQPSCQFSSYHSSIQIGSGVQIAPRCSFYPYNHSVVQGNPINKQPLISKGGITVGDGSWLGVGVTVLDGVSIGTGAVIGAGAVVTKDIPDNAIAGGMPARIIKMRPKEF